MNTSPKINRKPRAERTLEYYFAEIMDEIIAMYLVCIPEYDRDKFMTNIYEPLKDARISGDVVMGYFCQNGGSKLGKSDAALIACIYCIESGWARVEGQPDLAWVKLMDAQQYIALALTQDVSEPQLAKILDLARTEAKSKAAKESVAVSVQAWDEAKCEVFRLIQEKAQSGKEWKDVDQAALEIVNQVSEVLKSSHLKSQKQFWSSKPEKTIARWLLKMPDVAILFVKPKDDC